MAEREKYTKQTMPKFSMDEDFPALPIIQESPKSTTNSKSGNDIKAADIATSSEPTSSTTVATTTNTTTASIPASSNEFKPKSIAESTTKCGNESSEAGDSTHSIELLDNDRITGIPNDMINNQFGMLGLLKLTDIDPSFGVFAPGIDLSRQNLHNLPPPGELHNSFTSPLVDQHTLPPHEAEYDVPAEYRIHHRTAGRLLPDPPLAKLTDEILFWLFYNLCREEAQLVVAKELYNRDWRYHKKKMRWFTRVPDSEVIREGGREQSTYYCWDPISFQKVTQQITICYADLDDTPTTYQLSSPTPQCPSALHLLKSSPTIAGAAQSAARTAPTSPSSRTALLPIAAK